MLFCIAVPALGTLVALENITSYANRRDGIRPARVKREVCNGFDQLLLRQAICASSGKVGSKLIGSVRRNERSYCH
jgi:hypothetical protein